VFVSAGTTLKRGATAEQEHRKTRQAVTAFAKEHLDLFRSGTDYLTKSLGFVDLCYRSRHNWAKATRAAFERYGDRIDWDIA